MINIRVRKEDMELWDRPPSRQNPMGLVAYNLTKELKNCYDAFEKSLENMSYNRELFDRIKYLFLDNKIQWLSSMVGVEKNESYDWVDKQRISSDDEQQLFGCRLLDSSNAFFPLEEKIMPSGDVYRTTQSLANYILTGWPQSEVNKRLEDIYNQIAWMKKMRTVDKIY